MTNSKIFEVEVTAYKHVSLFPSLVFGRCRSNLIIACSYIPTIPHCITVKLQAFMRLRMSI